MTPEILKELRSLNKDAPTFDEMKLWSVLLMEEQGELIQQLSKYFHRGKDCREAVLEEAVDVMIFLDQLFKFFPEEELVAMFERKRDKAIRKYGVRRVDGK